MALMNRDPEPTVRVAKAAIVQPESHQPEGGSHQWHGVQYSAMIQASGNVFEKVPAFILQSLPPRRHIRPFRHTAGGGSVGGYAPLGGAGGRGGGGRSPAA